MNNYRRGKHVKLRKRGLYDPFMEKGACGVGLVANVKGVASYELLENAKTMLLGMAHRGATVRETGDGAGLMARIPHDLYKQKLKKSYDIDLPPEGRYATGIIFTDTKDVIIAKSRFTEICSEYGLEILCWRNVPVNNDAIGPAARYDEPFILQVFVVLKDPTVDFFQQLLVIRKQASAKILEEIDRFYIVSISAKIIVYKGRFDAAQLWEYYLDLHDPLFITNFAIVHARFATNTFPTWELAQPFRVLAHNGEINTLRGNINHMRSREGMLVSHRFKNNMSSIYPILEIDIADTSDTSLLDNAAEFMFKASTRSLEESLACLMPEAWETASDSSYRDYLRCNSFALEPWDGPATVMFSDGIICGAILDRNGLRPARVYVTECDTVFVASEVVCEAMKTFQIKQKSRLGPGDMILIDMQSNKLLFDKEAKSTFTRQVDDWLNQIITLENLIVEANNHKCDIKSNVKFECEPTSNDDLSNIDDYKETDRRLVLFGYNTESFNDVLLPMIRDKKESTASMGDDAPLACLSLCNPLSYEYFQQNFAQGTNPPMDSIRERIVMSLACPIGPEHNLLQPAPEQCQRLWLTSPILTIDDMEVLKLLSTKQLRSKVINITYSSKVGTSGLENTLKRVINDCAKAVRSNFNMLILSDRSVGPSLVPISALLAVGAAHQHLVNEHLRMKTALLVESGEVRDIHHFAVLLGFGADAICPYMVMQLIVKYQKLRVFHMDASDEQLFDRYRATCLNGLFHIMAKMGISTLQSFKGAQCFECVGLAEEVVEMCFTGTTSRIGGVGFEILASEVHQRHVVAYSDRVCDIKFAQNYGFIDWRAGGEYHLYSPQSIDLLSRAIHTNNLEVYRKFSCLHNELTKHCTLSGQLDFVYSNNPISLNEVESKACILKRFAAAAISFGSVSIEAYNSIVRAMKTLKCSSNCGEGGIPAGGEEATIKQIASGRFGVDLKYIVNAKELQIKIGQGSKPGEGGELPWYKMDKVVAETRRSMPLTGDRSPAPHHDVYSVEDLSQLVYDLRSANPTCIISLKLVSSVGVGVVATGAVKTGVKHVTISGHGGGTGGSNRTGIKNAGMPWELGIAESHQVLVLNNIRKKVTLEVDGQLQNGYDIVKAALLGADSFSFGTCVMIALGCTMCKKCHLNTCHVGIATQDKQLRKRFQGKEQSIVNYFNFIADEVRHIMAALGIRFFHELNGRTDLLVKRNDLNYKAQTLDFSLMLTPNLEIEKSSIQQHFVTFDEASKLEFQYVSRLSEFIVSNKWRQHKSLMLESKIGNIDRTFGTTLSGHVCRLIENLEEFPDNSIIIRLYGTAGQSLGAFLSKGLTLLLDGDANDFVGKGLSGGTIVVKPNSTDFKSQENTIAGNVLLYGATSGKAFFRGLVGERFCVRNSGAIAVCEGCGDHGCEYMTAGTAIILGSIGRNFAAGLAGGVAYVYDKFNNLSSFCNTHAVEISKLKDCNEIDKLKSIIQEFYEHTQSEVAWEILNAWSENIFRFIKLSAVVSLNHFDTVNDYRSLSRSSLISIQSEPSIDLDVIPDLEDIVNEKHKGFLLYEREKLAYRNVRERITDKDEIVNLFALKSGIKKQASRCINCGVPFCQSEFGCPVGCVISDFNKLVTEDDWKSALQRILQSNNFPEFTGRVCPAFCESACVLQPDPVTIRNVELVIAEHGFINNWIIPEIPSHRTGYRVSIVGSGPAGLAAASQLNKAGHDVVIYEQEAEVGGLLRYGIPPTRLNRKIIDRRINIMQREGVKLLVNYKIDDAKLLDLLSLSDSVVIAVGSSWPKELKVDGRYLENVFLASAFMNIWLTKGKPTIDVTDKRIVVIGQADCATTADCISMLVRENVKSVKCILLVSQCTQERHLSTVSSQCELNVAREEILEFCDFSSDQTEYSPKILCFLGNHNGDVRAVQFLSYKPTDAQPCGDHVDNPSNGYEQKTVECDMVMVSIGIDNYHDDNVRRLKRDIKFNKDKYSNDKINDYKTNIPDLFICGDCRIGSSAVVHAIAEGRRAARLVDLHLMGESHLAGTGGIVTDIYR